MSTTTENIQSHFSVNTFTENAAYQSDPLNVYRLLCKDKDHNILLESAEIDKKHLLKSLLLTDAAVKIVCHGNKVTFSPLSKNGITAVAYAALKLAPHAELSYSECQFTSFSAQALTASFPQVAQELDEKSRLMAVNPFESLRLFPGAAASAALHI